jgi:hypothetical protein
MQRSDCEYSTEMVYFSARQPAAATDGVIARVRMRKHTEERLEVQH